MESGPYGVEKLETLARSSASQTCVCLFVFTIVSHHQNDVKLYQLGQKTLVLFEHIVTYFIRSSNRPTEAGPEICLLRFLAVTTATS